MCYIVMYVHMRYIILALIVGVILTSNWQVPISNTKHRGTRRGVDEDEFITRSGGGLVDYEIARSGVWARGRSGVWARVAPGKRRGS